MVLEGARTLSEALAAGIEPAVVAIAEAAERTAAVRDALERLGAGVEVLTLTDRAFRSVAPAVSPQPVLALVPRPEAELPRSLAPDDLVLVLVGVSDPGNVGTIVRTAEACGACCVVVVGGADPWAPKVVRASAGSMLRVPVVREDDAADVLRELRAASAAIVAADPHDGERHDSGLLSERAPVALVLGSESHGLDRSLRFDHRIRIPMAGGADSLNVAMAATLLAFEYRR